MTKFSVDSAEWACPRFARLCYTMQWTKPTALGMLIMFWTSTRAAEISSCHVSSILDHLPVDTGDKAKLLASLAENGYVNNTFGEHYDIAGNDAYVKLQMQRRAAGRVGRSKMLMAMEKAGKPAASTKDGNLRTWHLYAMAYQLRYGCAPVRNASTNSIVAQLVVRLGSFDAPEVAKYYLEHVETREVLKAKHTLELLLENHAAYHTDWHQHVASEWSYKSSHERSAKNKHQAKLMAAGQASLL